MSYVAGFQCAPAEIGSEMKLREWRFYENRFFRLKLLPFTSVVLSCQFHLMGGGGGLKVKE